MKFARIFTKTIFVLLTVFCITVFAAVIYIDNSLSDEFKIKKGDTLEISSIVPVTAVYNGAKLSVVTNSKSVGETFSVDLKAFGIIPVSSVEVEVVDEMYVAVLGNPFGMKIYTQGVLVTEITDVATQNGNQNPAKDAGIKKGDYIVSVNGQSISTNEDLVKIVENSNGEKLSFEVMRENTKIYFSLNAVKSVETDNYKIGIWVKDSSAGVGTLTFYSPSTNVICGLGHGICDSDTGELLKLNSGQIVTADIISIEKGEVGSPGKLTGKLNYKTLGEISLNCEIGVYSNLKGTISFDSLTEIALKQEVKDGAAQILCTVGGSEPKLYNCEIKVRSSNYLSSTQNLLVTVTDAELLNTTGGIVQGMSGSPIIQNGKLIGAVTHVLVDDPTKGYGIFAENMLETANNVGTGVLDCPQEEQLKEAS